jgi:predicted RNase H-like HicB family nuclease
VTAIFYPAVMERGEGSSFAIWLPDWPGVVAASLSQAETVAIAERALAAAAEGKVERGEPMPAPSDWDAFELPADCDLVVRLALKLTPPDISERVNVYLPKSLIEQVDRAAAEWGMSRSSFFGLAVRHVVHESPAEMWNAVRTAIAQRRR